MSVVVRKSTKKAKKAKKRKPKVSQTPPQQHQQHQQQQDIVLPPYMLEERQPSAPLMVDAEEADQSSRWIMVQSDIGWEISGQRTSATKVIDGLRELDGDEKESLKHSLATVDGSKLLLTRLEKCIESENFQNKIWRRVQGIGEKMGAISPHQVEQKEDYDDEDMDIIEQSFVLITHQDVIDALAEHLVLSYLDNYHRDEIEVWKDHEDPSLLKRALDTITTTIKQILEHEALTVMWDWGKYLLPTSTLSLASFAFYYPQVATFVLALLWKILRIGLCMVVG